MPRNAEEKFNNEEERLPVLNSFITTTTTTISTSDNKDALTIQATAATTLQLHQQLQTTHLEQRKTFENLSKPPANPVTTENLLATRETTQTTTASATIATTELLDSSQVHDEEDFNTNESISRGSPYPITEIVATELATTTVTTTAATLYPIVIATLDTNRTATTPSLVSTSFPLSSACCNVSSVSDFSEPKKNSPSSLRKRKCQPISFNIKITAKENCRLATLRTRKAATAAYVPPAVDKEAAKGENKQLPLESCASVSAPDRSYLDAKVLNKIETLKFEVKKGGNKRKRINTNIGTRKRLTRKKVPNTTTNYNYNWSSEAKEEEHVDALSPNEVEDSNTTTVINISNKKRPRIMSLYERRYQNDEARSSGVVSNGLTSTRTSSASSSSAMHADAAADSPDISNQYYMSASSAAAAASAAVTSGTPLGSNGSSAAVSASSSAIAHVNHAPSMATLCNIGNTCYLNSVVYTLRFAPHFLHNLHHLISDLSTIQQNIVRQRAAKSSSLGRGISAVHMENARSWSSKDLASMEQYPNSGGGNGSGAGAGGVVAGVAGNLTQKSSHQLLTEKLHELYQSLHRNELSESMEPYHADTLLHAIQDVSSIFEGNQQQDAHEFLMCLLNSIRETSQTLIKTIAECPDVIVNGYIANPDEVDAAYNLEKDSAVANNHALSGSGGGNGGSSSSSLSTSNITKAYFFSRKSKRKEEGKNSKNSRLQSPLKDGSNVMQQQLQPTSNSLFYLNTVDLIGSGTNSQSNSNSNATTAAALKSSQIGGGAGADDEASSPVSLLKDKERLNEKIRELGLDFFSEDFEGVTVSTTKCLSCETITEQKESMIDIAVPVPISGYDSSDYTEKPSSFIQNSCITREYFRGENKYRCEQCTGYTEAIRSISYEVLPRLLVIQLSRFSGGMEKINSYIPTSFTLQCFCAKCCELSDANKLHIYKLYSVITHVGATMSVGHYIAYTCSLDWSNGYVNCPKDRRSSAQQQQQQQQHQTANGLLNNGSSAVIAQSASAASAAASVIASSGTSLMKKMKFGRSKASSSGDMSKNMKNLNGITSKTITNGIGKLSMNTTCHSLNCCATRLCSSVQQNAGKGNIDMSEESLLLPNGSNHSSNFSSSGYNNFSSSSGYGSTGRGAGVGGSKTTYSTSSSIALAASGPSAEPIWYMCDDDKIKAMTQREFEELLSPSRKITITPYLLFYARFDLQTPPSTSPPKQATTPPQPSWSSDSLQSGLHKI